MSLQSHFLQPEDLELDPICLDWRSPYKQAFAKFAAHDIAGEGTGALTNPFAGEPTFIETNGTAVTRSIPLTGRPSPRTENPIAAPTQLKQQAERYLFTRRIGQVVPAFGCAALLSYAAYATEPQSEDDAEKHRRIWVVTSDVESPAFTSPFAHVGHYTGATTATTLPSQNLQVEDLRGQVAMPADDQPRYDYREAIAYAKKMGLPTEFPL